MGIADRGGVVIHQHQQRIASTSQNDVYASEAKDKLQKEVENYQTLVQNMSTAMGVSYVVASSKFGGKAGAQAAENFQREMKQKEEQLKKGASALGNSAKQEFNKASSALESAVNNNNNTSSNYSPKEEDSGYSSSGTSVKVPQEDEEPVGRRKRAQMDDDELERMYYG